MNNLTAAHFAHPYILDPANPLLVNMIGVGGTGSHFLSALARMNFSLVALGHPGLQVNAFDDDIITTVNPGRQLFSESETGLYKSVVLISRLNRFFGTNWKAIPHRFIPDKNASLSGDIAANIYITCVDTVKARFETAE